MRLTKFREFLSLKNKFTDLESLNEKSLEHYQFIKFLADTYLSENPNIEREFVLTILCNYFTNAYGNWLNCDSGLCLTFSRFNHSCSPNSDRDAKNGAMTIRATSKIKKGIVL